MRTSKKRTSPLTKDLLTLFPVDSTANPSQTQESEKEPMMSATCGPKCLEAFGRLKRPGLWAKTFAALLIGQTDWYSSRCALTWKMKGTKYNRSYFQLQVSTRRMKDTGFSLLPTPTLSSEKDNSKKAYGEREKSSHLLPRLKREGLLPTPRASDTNGAGLHGNGGMDLRTAVQLLPTPTAQDAKNATLPASQTDRDSLPGVFLTAGMNGRLNPRFVGWMMGYPSDWMFLDYEATLQDCIQRLPRKRLKEQLKKQPPVTETKL